MIFIFWRKVFFQKLGVDGLTLIRFSVVLVSCLPEIVNIALLFRLKL